MISVEVETRKLLSDWRRKSKRAQKQKASEETTLNYENRPKGTTLNYE